MIAATIYENLKENRTKPKNHRFQKKIVSFWEKSWKDNGFETVVVTEKDFPVSSDFKNFCYRMEEVNRKIYGDSFKKMKEGFMWRYSISCWKRWFIFAELNINEPFYCGDYDVINNSLTPDNCEISQDLFFLNGLCPCWASGTSAQFKYFCDIVIKISEKNIDRISEFFKEKAIGTFYTDQSFFVCNHKDDDYKQSLINTSSSTIFLNGIRLDPECKLIHFSHNFTSRNCDKYSDLNRIKIIKKFMNEKESLNRNVSWRLG